MRPRRWPRRRINRQRQSRARSQHENEKVVTMGRYQFFGYRRENRRGGIRNHAVILPLDDLSNAAAEAVANNIKSTLALPPPYRCLQFGHKLAIHFPCPVRTRS